MKIFKENIHRCLQIFHICVCIYVFWSSSGKGRWTNLWIALSTFFQYTTCFYSLLRDYKSYSSRRREKFLPTHIYEKKKFFFLFFVYTPQQTVSFIQSIRPIIFFAFKISIVVCGFSSFESIGWREAAREKKRIWSVSRNFNFKML